MYFWAERSAEITVLNRQKQRNSCFRVHFYWEGKKDISHPCVVAMEAVTFRITQPSQDLGANKVTKFAKNPNPTLAWPESLLNLAILTGVRAYSVSFVKVCHRENFSFGRQLIFFKFQTFEFSLNYGGFRVPQSCDMYVASHCNPRDVCCRVR